MDQVSRPMLIVLAATIVLAALWFVALRPKAAQVADTPAAPVTAIAKAKAGAAAADAANAHPARGADGAAVARAPEAKPAANADARPAANPAVKPAAADASRRAAAVLRDISRGKVVVLLFWNAEGADDVATRGAVRGLSSYGAKVAIHVVPISRVGEYETVTRGVTVNQSPTTLVIDRKRRSRTIVGLSERGELRQAVDDAIPGRS
jgi:hypothetical protein